MMVMAMLVVDPGDVDVLMDTLDRVLFWRVLVADIHGVAKRRGEMEVFTCN